MSPARDAWAQKKRVVVEQFSGQGAERDKFRQMVISAVEKTGAEVVPDKKVSASEADLGLLSVSDNYPAAAKELKVVAFVGGSVGGSKKLTAKLKVKDASGGSLGDESWNAASGKALLSAIEGNLNGRVADFLGKASGGGAPPPPPVAAAEKPAPPPKADEDDGAKKKKKAADDEGGKASSAGENTVAASSESSSGGGGGLKGLDLMLGAHVYSRTFEYNQALKAPAQAYKLSAAPAISGALEYFFTPYVGVAVSGEYSVALFSKDSDGNIYRTSSMAFGADLRGRYMINSIELTGSVGYHVNSFKIVPEADDTAPPQVAGVNYAQVRAGGGVRIPVSDTVAVLGSAAYLHLLSMGELKSDNYYPNTTGRGGEGSAGIAFALPVAGLEARGLFDFRRYVFAMNPSDTTDPRVAGGAYDQYLGFTLAVGYRPR